MPHARIQFHSILEGPKKIIKRFTVFILRHIPHARGHTHADTCAGSHNVLRLNDQVRRRILPQIPQNAALLNTRTMQYNIVHIHAPVRRETAVLIQKCCPGFSGWPAQICACRTSLFWDPPFKPSHRRHFARFIHPFADQCTRETYVQHPSPLSPSGTPPPPPPLQ